MIKRKRSAFVRVREVVMTPFFILTVLWDALLERIGWHTVFPWRREQWVEANMRYLIFYAAVAAIGVLWVAGVFGVVHEWASACCVLGDI